MGGSSGAVGVRSHCIMVFPPQTDSHTVLFFFQLYSLFLTAAAGHLTAGHNNVGAWADAMLAGTQAMKRLP